jgi:hypothetical protein
MRGFWHVAAVVNGHCVAVAVARSARNEVGYNPLWMFCSFMGITITP